MIEIFKISLIAFMFYALGRKGMIFEFYQRWISHFPDKFSYPLGKCVMCFSGQCGFWFYIVKYFHSYNLIEHLFFVSAVIFLSVIYNYVFAFIND
jgi:hypothetical protein